MYNYWDDWTTPDADNNDSVANPYSIEPNSQDQSPMASPVTICPLSSTTPTSSICNLAHSVDARSKVFN